jgi:hypothetical protein
MRSAFSRRPWYARPGKRPGGAPKKGHRRASDAISAKQVALRLPAKAWRTIEWREGTNERLSSRFARVRVRVASIRERSERPAKEWLLIEWPEGEKEPTKYWLSTLPRSIAFLDLVDAAKLRWRVERDDQGLEQEVGLGHFKGRGWRGFHHHATMCIAAYGFLISERETIPPSGLRSAGLFPDLVVSDGYRPRGSPIAASTTCPKFDRHHAPTAHRCYRHMPATMPMLSRSKPEAIKADLSMTQ